jgi:hypothetical protein
MTSLSHSPTDTPDRRAAVRTASRASGRSPLRFHGPPDFILTTKATWEAQDVPSEPTLLRDDAAGAVLFPRLWTFPE